MPALAGKSEARISKYEMINFVLRISSFEFRI